MFIHEPLVSHLAPSFKIVVKIVKLDGDCYLIARFCYPAHIVRIWFTLIMCQETQGIDNLLGDSHAEQVIESVFRILHHIMEESCALLFRCLSRKPYC